LTEDGFATAFGGAEAPFGFAEFTGTAEAAFFPVLAAAGVSSSTERTLPLTGVT
jgi:hypothetical protein